MKPKKAIKELEKQLRKDPDNLVIRLKLAAVYREVGRRDDAVALYRSVAVAYHSQGRLVQAIAVCKSVLEIDPSQRETQALLAELDRMRALQSVETDRTAEAGEQALAAVARDQAGPEGGPPPSLARHPQQAVAADPWQQQPAREPTPGPGGDGQWAQPAAPVPAPPAGPAPRGYFAQQGGEDEVGPPPATASPAQPAIPAVPASPSPRGVNPLGVQSPREAATKPLSAVDAPPEFGARSGMTPLNRDPSVPPIDEVTPGSQMRRLRERASSRMPRTTQRGHAVPGPGVPGPGVRRSTPSMSHTPLPEPLALHDADPSVMESLPVQPRPRPPARVPRVTQQSGAPPILRRPPPLPLSPQDALDDDEDAMTRIADERISEHDILAGVEQSGPHGMRRAASEEAATTIAPDMLGDDEGPTIIAPPNMAAMAGSGMMPVEDDADEDALTRIADERSGSLDDFDDLPTPPPLGPLAGGVALSDVPEPPPSPEPEPGATANLKAQQRRGLPARGQGEKAGVAAAAKPNPKIPFKIPDIPRAQPDADLPSAGAPQARATRRMAAASDEPRPTRRYPRLTKEGNDSASDGPSEDLANKTLKDIVPPQEPRPTVKIPMPDEVTPYPRGNRLIDLDAGAFSDDAVTLDRALDEVEELEDSGDDAQIVTNVTRRPERPVDPTSNDDLELHQAFDKPFSDTISKLGPDGAVIDMPLSIFSVLPDEALAEMARRMTLRRFDRGEIVLREGEPGDACYVIAHGDVRVLKRDPLNPRGDLIEVARLGAGSLFGEFALLADRRRHATVQAVESCDIYEIPRRLLRELAATFPEVGPLLEKFYRERLLATLLSTAPFFKPLPEERRGELLARFKPRRAESGERIVVEGRSAGGLFLIVLGSVEITKRVSAKRSVLLATLGEGAYFGEMSLLKGGVACASVRAVGPTELAVMSPKDFYEVVADNPRLWDEVRREANRRQLELSQIVTGETNVT